MLFHLARPWRRKEIRIVSFDPTRGCGTAVVSMNRDEQIGLGLIGEIGALIERQIGVAVPREHYLGAQARLQQFAQSLGHVKHQIFLEYSLASDSSQIPSAMSGLKHYPGFSTLQGAVAWRLHRHRRSRSLGGEGRGIRCLVRGIRCLVCGWKMAVRSA